MLPSLKKSVLFKCIIIIIIIYLFIYLFFYSFQRESFKYMNSGRNSGALNSNTNLISYHIALITHDATMSVNSSITFMEF